MTAIRLLAAIAAAIIFLSSCTSVAQRTEAPPPAAPPPAAPAIQRAIDHGTAFLTAQYDADVGLLQESPRLRPNNYFLANDALLASHALTLTGETALAAKLDATLARYDVSGNDFVEAAWGTPIPWPPRHFTDPGDVVEVVGDKQIMTIRHDEPGYFYDWSAYANLAFMAAVNELNRGSVQSATRLYEIEVGTFDGRGFADKAYWDRDGVYETLGLAWGVYAAALLCVPPRDDLLAALLAQQDPATGGFHTHYAADEDRLADPNVETTSVAVLALHRLAQPRCPVVLGLPVED